MDVAGFGGFHPAQAGAGMRCGPEVALGTPLRAGSPDAYAGPPGGFGAFGARGHARRAAETLRKITRKAQRPALWQSRALPGAKKERLSVRRERPRGVLGRSKAHPKTPRG